MNVGLNLKISIVFQNLQNYIIKLIIQDLGRFYLKVSLIPNIFEEDMRFSLENKLVFIDCFPFPLMFFTKQFSQNLGENDFKHYGENLTVKC